MGTIITDPLTLVPSDATTAPAAPSHTLTLPVSCTVAELRQLLRQVPGAARLADVKILGAEVVASLTDLSELELRFVGGAK